MGQFWMNMDYVNAPETQRLADCLGIKRVGAVGLVIALFCEGSNKETLGRLDGWSAEDIAAAADWDGDAQAFYDALLASGIIYREGPHIKLIDWADYTGAAPGATFS